MSSVAEFVIRPDEDQIFWFKAVKILNAKGEDITDSLASITFKALSQSIDLLPIHQEGIVGEGIDLQLRRNGKTSIAITLNDVADRTIFIRFFAGDDPDKDLKSFYILKKYGENDYRNFLGKVKNTYIERRSFTVRKEPGINLNYNPVSPNQDRVITLDNILGLYQSSQPNTFEPNSFHTEKKLWSGKRYIEVLATYVNTPSNSEVDKYLNGGTITSYNENYFSHYGWALEHQNVIQSNGYNNPNNNPGFTFVLEEHVYPSAWINGEYKSKEGFLSYRTNFIYHNSRRRLGVLYDFDNKKMYLKSGNDVQEFNTAFPDEPFILFFFTYYGLNWLLNIVTDPNKFAYEIPEGYTAGLEDVDTYERLELYTDPAIDLYNFMTIPTDVQLEIKPARELKLEYSRDFVYGGNGYIKSTLKRQIDQEQYPYSENVYLFDALNKQIVMTTKADPLTGLFEFKNISLNRAFLVLSLDRLGVYKAVLDGPIQAKPMN